MGARVLEDSNGSGEVVASHLQVQQFVARFPHLLLDERRDVSLHALLRLLPEPEGARGVAPVERFAALPGESLGVAEGQPLGPRRLRGAIGRRDYTVWLAR